MNMSRAAESETPWLAGMLLAIFAGFGAIGVYSWWQHAGTRMSVFACCVLLALASHLVGAFIGFIFGIPKTVTTTSSSGESTTSYQGNTNLEQISDWLTKILVGAGLVELGKIGVAFDSMTKTLTAGNALGNSGTVVAPTIITLYAVSGFLIAYLYARIYLARELRDADRDDSPDTVLGQMNAALYQPGGYERAIQIGDDLLKIGAPSNARFWIYYASAYGQKYKADQKRGVADEMAEDRTKALDAVKKALTMDPTTKETLRSLWKPVPPSQDDDLSAFQDDPDFIALLK
jgi:tetratricopeptide (TPR) repeat protein